MTVPGVVTQLVAARRLEPVPADLPAAIARLQRAIEKLASAVTAHMLPTATGHGSSPEPTKR